MLYPHSDPWSSMLASILQKVYISHLPPIFVSFRKQNEEMPTDYYTFLGNVELTSASKMCESLQTKQTNIYHAASYQPLQGSVSMRKLLLHRTSNKELLFNE